MNKDQFKGRNEEAKGKGKDDRGTKGAIQKSAGKDHEAFDDRKEERKYDKKEK